MEVFECVVVDNTTFWKNGRIKIRLCLETNAGEGFKDFSENPEFSRNFNKEVFGDNQDKNLEGEGVVDHDNYAELSTCMGGAFDSGVFYLPQPNTRGLVTRIYSPAANIPRYVWIGALVSTSPSLNPIIEPKSESEYIQQINIPSDSEENKNGFNNARPNMVVPENKNHAILFKQKETFWSKDENGNTLGTIEDNDKSKKNLSWEETPTFNMAVIDKTRTFLIHNMYDKTDKFLGQAKISIDNSEGISITFDKVEDDKSFTGSMEILTNGTARLKSEYNSEIINTFEASSTTLDIRHRDKDIEGAITLSGKATGDPGGVLSIALEDKKSSSTSNIELKTGEGPRKDKSMININSSGNITLNPGPNQELFIGGGSGTNYLLAYPTAGVANSGAISNFEASSIVACPNIRV